MTYTFKDTPLQSQDTIVFNVANGPNIAKLSLFSQAANLWLDVATTTQPFFTDQGSALYLIATETNDRYTEYKIDFESSGISDETWPLFTSNLEGIYIYQLRDNAENILDTALFKLKNEENSTNLVKKKIYTSSNETRKSYVYVQK